MNRFRFVFLLLAVVAWSSSAHAQSGCKPQDPTGYFEGVATSPQAGKLNISLNLRCDKGRYAGDLATPVGTYGVAGGQFAAGQLHLKLEAGTDTLNLDGNLDAGVFRGKFVSNDETGPIELRRVGDPRTAAVAATSSLTKQQWHEDLAFLAQELPKRHANAFNFMSRERLWLRFAPAQTTPLSFSHNLLSHKAEKCGRNSTRSATASVVPGSDAALPRV